MNQRNLQEDNSLTVADFLTGTITKAFLRLDQGSRRPNHVPLKARMAHWSSWCWSSAGAKGQRHQLAFTISDGRTVANPFDIRNAVHDELRSRLRSKTYDHVLELTYVCCWSDYIEKVSHGENKLVFSALTCTKQN